MEFAFSSRTSTINGNAAAVGALFARVATPEHAYDPRTIRLLAIAWCLGVS